jgi:hypothetical protein
VASALATIETLTPFRYDGNTILDTVRATVQRAITKAMPREHRDNTVAVTAGDSAVSPEGVSVVATITLSDGALLRQRFDASTSHGSARIRVTRAGPPGLILHGLAEPVDVTIDTPADTNSAKDAQRPSLSSADARELAARRARDVKLEASLHGWKPLPIWYAFWVGTTWHSPHRRSRSRYVRYLYNGGRRRVWFIFW